MTAIRRMWIDKGCKEADCEAPNISRKHVHGYEPVLVMSPEKLREFAHEIGMVVLREVMAENVGSDLLKVRFYPGNKVEDYLATLEKEIGNE